MGQSTPPKRESEARSLLIEGLSDAVGFVGGALAGFWAAQALGLNLFEAGYGAGSLGAIALVSLGGGLGLHLARRWRRSRAEQETSDGA